MQIFKARVAVLYTHSDFTPWKENITACMTAKLIEALYKDFDVSIVHFAGFNTEFASLLKRFDLVFNVCYGYDHWQQTDICKWLDDNDIPHSSSSYVAQMLAQDKLLLPQFCQQVGLQSPKIFDEETVLHLNIPLLVKPRFGSMHRDIQVFENGNVPLHYLYHHDYLVQEFIRGREFTAAVVPDAFAENEICLHPVEIIPVSANEFFILGNKQPKQLNFEPDLSPQMVDEIKAKIFQLHKLIGLKGISRTDFKIFNNQIYILDVNSMPNLEPEKSFLPRICNHNGISYKKLIVTLIEFALKKRTINSSLKIKVTI